MNSSHMTAADRVRSMLDVAPVPFAALTIVERNEMVRLCRRGIATNVRFGGITHYVLHPAKVVEAMLRAPRLAVVR